MLYNILRMFVGKREYLVSEVTKIVSKKERKNGAHTLTLF